MWRLSINHMTSYGGVWCSLISFFHIFNGKRGEAWWALLPEKLIVDICRECGKEQEGWRGKKTSKAIHGGTLKQYSEWSNISWNVCRMCLSVSVCVSGWYIDMICAIDTQFILHVGCIKYVERLPAEWNGCREKLSSTKHIFHALLESIESIFFLLCLWYAHSVCVKSIGSSLYIKILAGNFFLSAAASATRRLWWSGWTKSAWFE